MIDWIENTPMGGPGGSPSLAVRVAEVHPPILRHRLMDWINTALQRPVLTVLIRMVRPGPEATAEVWNIVVDSCPSEPTTVAG